MYRRLTIFFACTTAILVAALAWVVSPRIFRTVPNQGIPYDETLVFPIKTFLSTKAFVAVKGTLAGDWLAYKNNTYSILLLQANKWVILGQF